MNNNFGLFNDRIIHPNYTEIYFYGNIKSYDPYFDIYKENINFVINYNFSYMSYLLSRNSFSLQNFIDRFGFIFDTIILPNFKEINDAGIENYILPFSINIGAIVYPYINDEFSLNIFSYFGVENVYNYYTGFNYGLKINSNIKLSNFIFGINLELPQFNQISYSLSIIYNFEKFTIGAELSYENNFFILALPLIFNFNKELKFSIGLNYNFYYNGITIFSGLILNNLQIFNIFSKTSICLSYSANNDINIFISFDQFLKK